MTGSRPGGVLPTLSQAMPCHAIPFQTEPYGAAGPTDQLSRLLVLLYMLLVPPAACPTSCVSLPYRETYRETYQEASLGSIELLGFA